MFWQKNIAEILCFDTFNEQEEKKKAFDLLIEPLKSLFPFWSWFLSSWLVQLT